MPDRLNPTVAGKCGILVDLLGKWNDKINLVSRSTIPDVWERHIADSLQVADFAAATGKWLDIGSGGGFPAIPCAFTLDDAERMTLVEADSRKCAFLRTVSRETSTPFRVVAARWEFLAPSGCDTLSARALAPLRKLIEAQAMHGTERCRGLYLKGRGWRKEVDAASASWRFSIRAEPSMVSDDGRLLVITNVEPK